MDFLVNYCHFIIFFFFLSEAQNPDLINRAIYAWIFKLQFTTLFFNPPHNILLINSIHIHSLMCIKFCVDNVLRILSPLEKASNILWYPYIEPEIPNSQSKQKNGPQKTHQVPEIYKCYLIWIKCLCRWPKLSIWRWDHPGLSGWVLY